MGWTTEREDDAIHPVLEGYGRRRPDAAEPAAWADGWARLPGPVLFLIIGLTYLLLAQMVLWVNDPVRLGAGFWPAGGVTTAALLALPTRRWGWVIAAVGLAEFGGDVAHGYPLAAAAWWTIGNVVGPVVGASLVRRFVHPRGRLVPLRNLVGFLALGALAVRSSERASGRSARCRPSACPCGRCGRSTWWVMRSGSWSSLQRC